MPKRRTTDSDNRYLDADDNPIGLTSAFAPVKGPQSVEYDKNDDPVGLTSAFGVVPSQDEPRAWDEAGKWKDFDWDAAFSEPDSGRVAALMEDEDSSDALPADPSAKTQGSAPTSGSGASDASSASGTVTAATASSASDASAGEASQPSEAGDADTQGSAKAGATDSRKQSKGPKHGRHAAAKPELSPRMKKSQRTRRVLIVLVILLILVLAALGYFFYNMFTNSQQEASQQTQEQVAEPRRTMQSGPADDAVQATAKLADVPNLTVLIGKTQDEAIATIGRGALVTTNRELKEEGNPIKVELNIALTEEAADSKTGTPTVYLGLGEDGRVRQAGYSASASALGFGALSFADAVVNEHAVEKTLAKIGVTVPEGSAQLPQNKDEYSTYSSDGTTVVRERCSFEGETAVGETPCTWSSVLSYDYTTQVVTGNLADTVRIIYVYVTVK